MALRSWRWRRRLNLLYFGIVPVLLGAAIEVDGLLRARRVSLSGHAGTAPSLRILPYDQQLFPIELVVGGLLVLAGGLYAIGWTRNPKP